MYKNEKNCVLFRFLGRRLGTRLNKLMLNQNRLLFSLIVGNNYWMHGTRLDRARDLVERWNVCLIKFNFVDVGKCSRMLICDGVSIA
jgi:hypothetical protein